MLWIVRHVWPSGARFVFNFYHQFSLLALWNGNGTASILHSREGVTQGGTLAMIVYRIGILQLIKNLKRVIPNITQPWYDDNARDLGKFVIIDTYFDFLTCQGTGRGYHPELS